MGFSLPCPADAKMAAINPPKKSTKIVWRTCISCTTRLSELCYDTHTLCEACRGKVCNSTSFCKECENWTDEFRKLYVRHKRSLLLKRVSKKDKKGARAKAKSPFRWILPPLRWMMPPIRWMMLLVQLLRSLTCLLLWLFCPLIRN